MFNCKVCVEKTNRIADLHKQIEFLKSFQGPPTPGAYARDLEADAILSGQNDIIEISGHNIADETTLSEAEDLSSERDRILTGTY